MVSGMTQNEKLKMLEHLTGETDQGLLSTYLTLAQGVVTSKCYPFGDGTEEVPAKYHTTQVEIAAFMLNKRGAEGEKSHTENGVSRTYENGDVPHTLLRRITPMVSVLGSSQTETEGSENEANA